MRRLGAVLVGVVLAAASLVTVGVAPSGALTTITVTTNADSAAGSLRQALTDAAAAADDVVIVIQPGVGTIAPATVLPIFPAPGDHALTIQGNGATVQGNNTFGLIDFESLGVLTVDNLTLANGTNPALGGAIHAIGPVSVTSSTFTGNTAPPGAGGLGGAIGAAGAVTVNNSTFSGNAAAFAGGAIATLGSSSVTVTNSTFTGNSGGLAGGAIAAFPSSGANPGAVAGPVSVTNSTLTANTTSGAGGAIYAEGPVTVTNSTVTANAASMRGGGISVCGARPVVLVYATVVANSAPAGANIDGHLCLESGSAVVTAGVSDPLSSFGSVVALPQGGGANCGTIADDPVGYNFSDDASCGFAATTDKQTAGNPLLAALSSNGGPTQTRLPETGSPLIDAIPSAACQTAPLATGITTDQRGLARPEQAGGACDIGAVEVQIPAAVPVEILISFTG